MVSEMEKLGASTKSPLTKTASKGCPECGGKVEVHGAVYRCQNCGTEPFENEVSKPTKSGGSED